MHEPRVHAERDVVEKEPAVRAPDVDATFRPSEGTERCHWFVTVEPEVAREVIARPERDADERGLTLERHLRHRCERAVAPGDAEHLRGGPARDARGILSRLQ